MRNKAIAGTNCGNQEFYRPFETGETKEVYFLETLHYTNTQV